MQHTTKGIKISCKEATYLSSLYQAGKLSRADKAKYLLHLMVCPPCYRFVKQVKKIAKLLSLYFKSFNDKTPYQLSDQKKQDFQVELMKNINRENS